MYFHKNLMYEIQLDHKLQLNKINQISCRHRTNFNVLKWTQPKKRREKQSNMADLAGISGAITIFQKIYSPNYILFVLQSTSYPTFIKVVFSLSLR